MTKVDLGEFDGRQVRGTTIKITSAGDGLSKALRTAPTLLHFGDKVFIVMEAIVGPITHDPIEDDPEGCLRKQSVAAQTVTLVSEKLVRQVLDAQQEANEKLEQVDGQLRLSADAKLEADHLAGLHKRRRPKCSLCQPSDEEVARADELAARRARHGDGEGTPEDPVPPARRYRTRGTAAKKAGRATKKK